MFPTAEAAAGCETKASLAPARGWSADPARGPPHLGDEAGKPTRAKRGRAPLRSGAQRRFGAPCGDFWLGPRILEKLSKAGLTAALLSYTAGSLQTDRSVGRVVPL
jgi:hypothetical protein